MNDTTYTQTSGQPHLIRLLTFVSEHFYTTKKFVYDLFGNFNENLGQENVMILDIDGTILNWDLNNEVLCDYSEQELLGQHLSFFYLPEDRRKGLPEKMLRDALREGKAVKKGNFTNKNGSIFWGSLVLTPIHCKNQLLGFTKVLVKLSR